VTNSLYKFGKFCARHGWLVFGIWIVIIISLVFVTKQFGGQIANTFSLPNSNSQLATNIVESNFPQANYATTQLVFYSNNGILNTPENQETVSNIIDKISTLPSVSSTSNPFVLSANSAISPDQKIGYANIDYSVPVTSLSYEDVTKINTIIQQNNSSNLQIEIGGSLIGTYPSGAKDNSETYGLIAAAVILLIAFGSVVVMGLPLISSLTGIAVGTMLILILAKFIDIPSVGPAVATMIGIGVGIDYALFIITRHREQIASGLGFEESIGRTVATSGQAVIVAGGTVIIANLGLLVVQIPLVTAMAFATALAIASAILVSITLLPAILGILGKHINALKIPFLNRKIEKTNKQKPEDTFWGKWALMVTNKPWIFIAGSLIFLALLIAPVFKIELGSPNPAASPPNQTQTKAYNLISEGFGVGVNNPLLVAVSLPENQTTQNIKTLENLETNIKQNSSVAAVTPPIIDKNGNAALFSVIPVAGQDATSTTELVNDLRVNILPKSIEGSESKAFVGGVTATFIDITDQISSRMVKFIGLVLVLTFVLLMFVFRSLFIPFKAVVMNLLSVLAAFGVIVMIFQWGWGKDLIGLAAAGPIVAYVPMMIFAILFGLSMDYEVFILSRVRESYLKNGDNKKAVVEGIAHTARLITAAALVMISVFLAFVISTDPVIKMFGIGLAFAVLIDATIIRLVLVPATMDLAGKINWWFPKWLGKIIPDIHFDDATVFDSPSKSKK
jgi:RND superfamily putative drug exporter